MSTTSKVAMVTCWALLVLTMFPERAIAGRYVPAPPPASCTAPQVVQDDGPTSATGALGLDDTQFRDASRYRKMMRVGYSKDAVKSWRDTTTTATTSAADSESIYGHRLLVGSSPPICAGKCGSCNPCNPIHVAIGSPHGALTQQEYYPEVWRCKCGNKLFMP